MVAERPQEKQSAEKYLRGLLSSILDNSPTPFEKEGPKTTRLFGKHSIVLDGTIGKDWVVELEARTTKQVRGVITDLLLHPRRKKMLIVLVEPTPTSRRTAKTVEEHLYQAVTELRLSLDDWCIVGLSRDQERDEHVGILRERFIKAGILSG